MRFIDGDGSSLWTQRFGRVLLLHTMSAHDGERVILEFKPNRTEDREAAKALAAELLAWANAE